MNWPFRSQTFEEHTMNWPFRSQMGTARKLVCATQLVVSVFLVKQPSDIADLWAQDDLVDKISDLSSMVHDLEVQGP
jgi:hypothetical protein